MTRKNSIKYELTAGIHTLCIKTKEAVNSEVKTTGAAIKSIRYDAQSGWTKILLNLNKLNGFIYKYEEFVDAFEQVLYELGIRDYELVRVDMAFDSYDKDHYQQFAKLNRLLISMFSVAYKVKNNYRSLDLFTNKQLSIAIKNPNSFEIENYDKEKESNGKDIAKSRFEIRSTRMNNKTIEQEFIVNWDRRFDSAYRCFKITLDRYNEELFKLYQEEVETDKKMKWTTFFRMYQNCIFTRRQGVKLLTLMGVKEPEERYNYFSKKYKIKTYREIDVINAMKEIQRARNAYFMGEKTP